MWELLCWGPRPTKAPTPLPLLVSPLFHWRKTFVGGLTELNYSPKSHFEMLCHQGDQSADLEATAVCRHTRFGKEAEPGWELFSPSFPRSQSSADTFFTPQSTPPQTSGSHTHMTQMLFSNYTDVGGTAELQKACDQKQMLLNACHFRAFYRCLFWQATDFSPGKTSFFFFFNFCWSSRSTHQPPDKPP